MHLEWRERFQDWAQSLGIRDTTGIELVHWLRMVNAAYDRVIEAHLAPSGLSGPRLRILVFLYLLLKWEQREGISPSLLMRWHGVSKSTMSILLKNLEDEGWIRRTSDPRDRRRICIHLTEKALELMETHAAAHLRFLNQLANTLSPEERLHLMGLLEKLYQGLAQNTPKDVPLFPPTGPNPSLKPFSPFHAPTSQEE